MDRCSSVGRHTIKNIPFTPFMYEYNVFNTLQHTLYRILMAVFSALITQYCKTDMSLTCMLLWYTVFPDNYEVRYLFELSKSCTY